MSEKRELSGCTGKVKYPNQYIADKARIAMEKKYSPSRFNVYMCWIMPEHWHVGSRPPCNRTWDKPKEEKKQKRDRK